MPPSRKARVVQSSQPAAQASKAASSKTPFPEISPKQNLDCRILLEDQIMLIGDFLTAKECKELVQYIENQPLELTPLKKKGEAERVNYRTSMSSPEIAHRLYDLLSPHLPEFPCPTSMARRPATAARKAHSFNSNIRLYKYTSGQHFGPHYDDSVRDLHTGTRSEWTLLIYLTGVEDGVEGGETLFYKEEKGAPRETIRPQLNRGTALLHRHGNECLLHEGSPVLKGTKYILRSDLMFKN